MQVKLEKVYPLPAPASVGWQFLQDIKGVAECMPGARITERIDATHYKGEVAVKIGPASAQFNGDIEIKGMNPERRELQLVGRGTDSKGTSSATMELTASIRAVADGACELVGISEVTVNGKMASFGGRMMTQVSDQILQQFAANFTRRVVAMGGGAEAAAAAATIANQPRHLNALALVWSAIAGFIKSLFGGKSRP